MAQIILGKKPSIVFFHKPDAGAIDFYRCIQPMNMLAQAGWTVTQLPYITAFAHDEELKKHMPALLSADIIYINTPGREYLTPLENLHDLDTTAKELGDKHIPQKFIFDYDDSLWDVPPYNPAFLWYGTADAYFNDPVTGKKVEMYKNGKTYSQKATDGEIITVKFDKKKNLERLNAVAHFLNLGHTITTTTSYLSTKLAKHIDGAALDLSRRPLLVPNAIDTNYLKPYTGPRNKDEVHILWTMSSSHAIDFQQVSPILGNLMRKYPNVHLHLMGDKNFEIGRNFPLSRLYRHPYINDVPTYWEFLSSLPIDIGIAWVNNTPFNLNKSPLKVAEYMALGVVPVASKTLYGDHFEEGVGIMLTQDLEELSYKLELLITDKVYKRKIIEDGSIILKDRFTTEAVLPKLEAAFYAAICKD